ncbi:MAG: GNAT family N-acetyltransferase, partial [Actinobacteria bacterium]|nr:GNAT family N-acetyltransferase [Actinomycetota bacterium]
MQNNMSFNNNPSDSEIQYIKDELKLFNDRIVGDDNHKQINIIVKNDRDEIIGGLIGGTYWEWLHIDRFWVHENYRSQGIGKSVLKLAEDEAKNRGCNNVHLDTHDFQAVNFYKKQGYIIRCELNNLPNGHTKY